MLIMGAQKEPQEVRDTGHIDTKLQTIAKSCTEGPKNSLEKYRMREVWLNISTCEKDFRFQMIQYDSNACGCQKRNFKLGPS